MTNPITEVKPYVYTNPQGQQLEVWFILDAAKKGYINATAIGQQFEKYPYDWLRNQHTQAYIQELLNDMNRELSATSQSETNLVDYDNSLIPLISGNSRFGTKSIDYDKSLIPFQTGNSRFGTKTISYDDFVITVQGGHPGQNGTWLHPKLAVIFARWMSPHFAVWCDKLIAQILQQHPAQPQHQELVPAVMQALAAQEQRFVNRINQFEQRFEQRFEQHINQVAQIFNRLYSQSQQETKHALGQIHNGINQLPKILARQQQQMDLLQPPVTPVRETIQQTILEYQQVLEQILHSQQDELVRSYLVGINDNLERLIQRFATEPMPATSVVTLPTTQPVTNKTSTLVAEIKTLRTQGQSWSRIAQDLNARGIATPSGKGKWHGSSVQRYVG